VTFVVGKVAPGQDFLQALRFSPCQYHSTSAQTHLHQHIAVPEGQAGDAWEPSEKHCTSGNQTEMDTKVL
jgi:hypothetical protein